MSTARDLCTAALQYLQVVGQLDTPQEGDMQRAFADLNDLMDSLSTDEYMVYSTNSDTYTLIGGTQSYTIGPTGTLVGTRPLDIISAYIVYNSVSYEVSVINDVEYNSIGLKLLQTTLPQMLYYNQSFPNGTLFPWPIPSGNIPLTLTYNSIFTSFAMLDTAVSFPPGMARFLKWNLIKEIGEAWGKEIPPSVIMKANESKAALRRLNSPQFRMTFDAVLMNKRQTYNIYKDGPR